MVYFCSMIDRNKEVSGKTLSAKSESWVKRVRLGGKIMR